MEDLKFNLVLKLCGRSRENVFVARSVIAMSTLKKGIKNVSFYNHWVTFDELWGTMQEIKITAQH